MCKRGVEGSGLCPPEAEAIFVNEWLKVLMFWKKNISEVAKKYHHQKLGSAEGEGEGAVTRKIS